MLRWLVSVRVCAFMGMSYIVWGVFVHHRTGGMVLPHINDVND
jgi:hypothetical protein